MMAKQIRSMAVPRLRLVEFRNDQGWASRNLGELVTFFSGGTPSKAEPSYWKGDIPWISASSMYETNIADSDLKVTSLAIGKGTRLASKGSLLVLVRGSMLFNRVPMGIAVVDMAFNQDVKALKVGLGINARFLLNQLIAISPRIPINETGIGAGKIETDTLVNLPVYLPSEAEQQKIADCLTSLDEVIAAQGRKVEVLKVHKRGLMQQLFPREGETHPRLRFPEFRNAPEWEEHKLGEIADISRGKGISKADIAEGGVTPCIRYGELYTIYGEIIDQVRSHTNVPTSELVLSEAGDVILPASGETKEDIATCSAVLDSGVALGGDLNIVRSNVDGRFLSYYLNGSRRREIAKVAQGDTVVHLYPKQLEKLTVNIPVYKNEQQRIADCLFHLDTQIASETDRLAALKTHKRGLMQQLFPAPRGN